MKTRVHHLKDTGIGCAWFNGHTGEQFVLGDLNLAKNDLENDDAPVEQARFVVNGKINLKSNFTEKDHTRDTPIPERSNPNGGVATIVEGPATLFCLGSTNPGHKIISPHKWDLKSEETMVIKMTGYLALAEGSVDINGFKVGVRKIIKLSGNEVTIKAGSSGALVAVLEMDFEHNKLRGIS